MITWLLAHVPTLDRVPNHDAWAALDTYYEHMIADSLFVDEPSTFEHPMDRCHIQQCGQTAPEAR